MSACDPPIIVTPDGSRTALSQRYGEAYGSRHGAAAQAHHVFLRGTATDTHPAPRVLEIGFGLGVNLRATLEQTSQRGAALDYVAYEFDPAPPQVLAAVAEGGAEGADHPAWRDVLARWPTAPGRPGAHPPLHTVRTIAPTPAAQVSVQATVHFTDALTADLGEGWASAAYLDGFSPTRNPEVWTPAFVARLARTLAPGGVLATYSAAGHVRRALEGAGLRVERRPGAPGKRECLRAEQVNGG